MKKVWLIFIGIIFLNNNAYAYLDPGTGGAIIGSLWPLLIIIIIIVSTISAFLVKYFWNPIKKFPQKFRKEKY